MDSGEDWLEDYRQLSAPEDVGHGGVCHHAADDSGRRVRHVGEYPAVFEPQCALERGLYGLLSQFHPLLYQPVHPAVHLHQRDMVHFEAFVA